MMKRCYTLEEWEQILSEKIKNVVFLGQVELSQEDAGKLEELIRTRLRQDGPQGMDFLMERVPTCLAMFLVCQGIWGYREGSYWSKVAEVMGFDDITWQARLGQFFLDYLKSKGLLQLDVESESEGFRRFVTPILLHGGIPQRCLGEFFSRIVLSFINEDVIEEDEVKDRLFLIRDQEFKKKELQKEIEGLKEEAERLAGELREKDKMSELSAEEETYKEQLASMFFSLWKIPWEDRYADILTRLPWERLVQKCSEYKALLAGYEELASKQSGFLEGHPRFHPVFWSGLALVPAGVGFILFSLKWVGLFFLLSGITALATGYCRLCREKQVREKRRKEYEALENQVSAARERLQRLKEEISQMLSGLPVPPDFSWILALDSADKLSFLKKVFSQWRNCVHQKRGLEIQVAAGKEQLPQVAAGTGGNQPVSRESRDEWSGSTWEAIRRDRVTELRKAKAAELERISILLSEKEKELAKYPVLLPNVDKPIERFLLYGGEWAEKWVLGSLKLAVHALRERKVPEWAAPHLPVRVLHAFQEWWWENFSPESCEETGQTSTEPERYSAPVLALDAPHGDLKIVVDRHRFYIEETGRATRATLKIVAGPLIGGDPTTWVKEIPLRAYRRGVAGLETEFLECYVPLVESYQVSLMVDGETRRVWQVLGLSEQRPFCAFTEDGKQVTGGSLPRTRLWLLLLEGYVLPSHIKIVEDATPPWSAEAFKLFLVDLSEAKTFYLADSQGVMQRIPLGDPESFAPFLEGGETVPFASVDGAPIYLGKPPAVVIPRDGNANLTGWSIIVRRGEGISAERQRCFLSELPEGEVFCSEDRAAIPLAIPELLGSEPAGRFTLRLRSPDKREYVFCLAVVPELLVISEPPLLLPLDQGDRTAGVTVIVSENAKFEVIPPARIVAKEDDAYEVLVPQEEDEVKGMLTLAQPWEECSLPLTIKLPKVRWRLQGLQGRKFSSWQDRVEEVWLGDWQKAEGGLFLELQIPLEEAEAVWLHLRGSQQFVTRGLRNGGARFRLLEFTDTLKRLDEEVATFTLKIFGPRQKLIGEGPLFRVRCRWKVEGVECSMKDLLVSRQLKFNWREKGEASNRVLRLWRLWEPWAAPITEHIKGGMTALVVEREKALLPSGRYLAQFDVEDDWFADGAVSFPAKRFNVADIELNGGEPYVKDWVVQSFPGKTEIKGVLVNFGPGREVTGVLWGMVGGKAVTWQRQTVIGSGGRFSFDFSGEALGAGMHWFGLFTNDDPLFYDFRVLPDASLLEYCLTHLAPQEVGEILELGDRGVVSVRIACHEGHLDCPVLPFKTGHRVLQAWAEGRNSVEIGLPVDQTTHTVRLEWSERGASLFLKSGVMCTGCGMILPDQQAWFEHSSGRLSDHPGLRLNYTNVPVSLLVTWDFQPVIRECRRRYSQASDELLLLYSAHQAPFPEGTIPGIFADVEKMVELLWARERERAHILWRGIEG